MKEACFPRLEDLRGDRGLHSFDNLTALLFSAADRIKTSGKKVIAKGPLTPVEPFYAAGLLPYDACTWETFCHSVIDRNSGLIGDAQDAGLNSDFNPWNLIALGAIFTGKNRVPIDIYSTACGTSGDQVKKCWQVISEFTGAPAYFWEIPKYDPEAEKPAIEFLKAELKQLFDFLMSQTDIKITDESLHRAIREGNLLRHDLMDLNGLLQSPIIPISSLDFYLSQFFMSDYAQDPTALHEAYRQLINELKERTSQGIQAPTIRGHKPLRIYVMGEDSQEFQLLNIIEQYGGVLVGCDSRLSYYYSEIKETGPILDNLANWMWRMPHNMSTPDRIKETLPHIKKQRPEAIIISSVVGSRNQPGAEKYIRDAIRENLNIPVLSIETSLPGEDIQKIDYQLRAFMEMSTS